MNRGWILFVLWPSVIILVCGTGQGEDSCYFSISFPPIPLYLVTFILTPKDLIDLLSAMKAPQPPLCIVSTCPSFHKKKFVVRTTRWRRRNVLHVCTDLQAIQDTLLNLTIRTTHGQSSPPSHITEENDIYISSEEGKMTTQQYCGLWSVGIVRTKAEAHSMVYPLFGCSCWSPLERCSELVMRWISHGAASRNTRKRTFCRIATSSDKVDCWKMLGRISIFATVRQITCLRELLDVTQC